MSSDSNKILQAFWERKQQSQSKGEDGDGKRIYCSAQIKCNEDQRRIKSDSALVYLLNALRGTFAPNARTVAHLELLHQPCCVSDDGDDDGSGDYDDDDDDDDDDEDDGAY